MMKTEDLSIRARVALGAMCLEMLLECFVEDYKNNPGWLFVLSSIWDYTSKPPGDWHYKMAEIIPFSVEEDLPFEEKGIDFLEKEKYDLIRELYLKTPNQDIKKVIDKIFEIGTIDLYTSIHDKSPQTISRLQEIINITQENNLQIPSLDRFVSYSINTNDGWGNDFDKSKVF